MLFTIAEIRVVMANYQNPPMFVPNKSLPIEPFEDESSIRQLIAQQAYQA